MAGMGALNDQRDASGRQGAVDVDGVVADEPDIPARRNPTAV